jgi:hypothetical protein
VKKAFVKALRAAFEYSENDVVPLQYRFNRDFTKRQINIWRDFPQRAERYPFIVVTTKAGKSDMTYVGDEFSAEITEEIEDKNGPKGTGLLFSGMLEITVNIIIACKSLRDVEAITDLTLFFIRHLFRDKFYNERISYTKITIEGQRFEDGIFSNSLTIPVYTEFNNIVPLDLYETIQSLNLEITATEDINV